ncbi:unnamed protein product [Moneuplotes crassus]|uniref:Uncharacterized protein n=1 Tax=Euplotes crassus TaxID=5936 RepID=A0AAD1XPP8_EUPCR|nr:unnamed protein product [Moneuplotes crassus]
MEKILGLKGNNYLLVRGKLGRSRPPTMHLPGGNHAYGMANKYDKDAIKKLTNSWTNHIHSEEKLPNIDYIRLNKVGCKKKIINPRDLSLLRKQQEPPRQAVRRGRKKDYLKFQADMTISYGKPVDYHNSMKQLMSGEYGSKAERETISKYEFHSQQKSKSRYKKAIQMTKASSILAKYKDEMNNLNSLENFKLKKYKDVKSKVREVIDQQIQRMNNKREANTRNT